MEGANARWSCLGQGARREGAEDSNTCPQLAEGALAQILKLDDDLGCGALMTICAAPGETAGPARCLWRLRTDSACRRRLRSFLEATTPLLGKCVSAFSTQLRINESLRAVKATLADKTFQLESFSEDATLRRFARLERSYAMET